MFGHEGKVSAPRSLLGEQGHCICSEYFANDEVTAGLGAGMTEAVLAVTPSETIKCALATTIVPFA